MSRIIRSSILIAVLSAGTLLGYFKIVSSEQARQVAELAALNEELAGQLAEREAMLERLGRSHRLAHIQVLEQRSDAAGLIEWTDVRFIELDSDGAELGRQEFTLPGNVMMVDAWTVKFDQERVAEGHPLAGRTLVLLRRIYSELMRPVDGFAIDTPGAIPPAYAATPAGRFQQQIWEHFWDLATDAAAASQMGVRVAQGEAIYKPVLQGQSYELSVDASGGISLTPLAPAS